MKHGRTSLNPRAGKGTAPDWTLALVIAPENVRSWGDREAQCPLSAIAIAHKSVRAVASPSLAPIAAVRPSQLRSPIQKQKIAQHPRP